MDAAIQVDAHPPREIAELIERAGVAKARLDVTTTMVLAVLAGAFISMGALLFVVVSTDTQLGFGPGRLLGGAAFSLGLVLVVVAGAELFTGNNLIAMAWASRLIGTREVVRHWVLVLAGNAIGCAATVALVWCADVGGLGQGAVGRTATAIATAKVQLPAGTAFARAVLCNALVCLAVWLAMGGRSTTDKIVAVMLPVTAFVALGLEHSIANLFLLPYAALIDPTHGLGWGEIARNVVVVTAGNLAGGTCLVAGVYWLAFRRVAVTRS